jgi:hypothetical protein
VVIGVMALGGWLALAAQSPAPAVYSVQQQEAIRAEARLARTSRAADRTAARAALRAVLSRRAFADARTESWQASLRRRFEQWFSDLWNRVLGSRRPSADAARALAWTASILAVSVLLAWLWRIAARRRAEAPLALDARPAHHPAGRELALEAAALIGAGRTRDAARLAYRAALYRLEEEGAIRVDDARTPRESLGLLPPLHRRRPTLSALTAAFERIWYGSRDASADEGREIIALLQDMECLSREHAS